MCVCARAWIRSCVCLRARVWVWVRERERVLAYLSNMPWAGAILSASSLAPPYFSTLSHKQQDFRKKDTEHKMCLAFLYRLNLKHFSFKEEFSEILSQMWERLHVKYPLFLSRCNETENLGQFSKTSQLSSFIKIRSVGAKLFYADGQTDEQTDTRKLIVAFRSFTKASKN